MGATGKQTKVGVEVEDLDGGGKVPLGSSATSEKRGGALLFDSEHAGADVVEDGEKVLATRSMRTIHIPLVGEVAVHMLDVPHGPCASPAECTPHGLQDVVAGNPALP